MFLDVLYDFVEIFVVRLVGYGIVIFPPGRLNVKNLPLGDLRAVYAPKLECFLADTGRRLALRYESQLEAILLKHFRLADLIYYPVLRGFLLRKIFYITLVVTLDEPQRGQSMTIMREFCSQTICQNFSIV